MGSFSLVLIALRIPGRASIGTAPLNSAVWKRNELSWLACRLKASLMMHRKRTDIEQMTIFSSACCVRRVRTSFKVAATRADSKSSSFFPVSLSRDLFPAGMRYTRGLGFLNRRINFRWPWIWRPHVLAGQLDKPLYSPRNL